MSLRFVFIMFAEELAASIETEIKRIRRRKSTKLTPTHSLTAQSDSSDGEQPSTSSPMSAAATCSHGHSSTQQSKDNTPLFTFK